MVWVTQTALTVTEEGRWFKLQPRPGPWLHLRDRMAVDRKVTRPNLCARSPQHGDKGQSLTTEMSAVAQEEVAVSLALVAGDMQYA